MRLRSVQVCNETQLLITYSSPDVRDINAV